MKRVIKNPTTDTVYIRRVRKSSSWHRDKWDNKNIMGLRVQLFDPVNDPDFDFEDQLMEEGESMPPRREGPWITAWVRMIDKKTLGAKYIYINGFTITSDPNKL